MMSGGGNRMRRQRSPDKVDISSHRRFVVASLLRLPDPKIRLWRKLRSASESTTMGVVIVMITSGLHHRSFFGAARVSLRRTVRRFRRCRIHGFHRGRSRF